MTREPNDGRKMRSLRELSQDVQPSRDLWAGIEPHLAGARQSAGGSRWRTWMPPVALAASVMLVAFGMWIGGRMGSTDRQLAQQAVTESTGFIRASLTQDPEYRRQRDDLLRALPEKLDKLPPESRQHVEESLKSIQQAIAAIETELGRDAGNVLLQELLISTSQEEMRVLTAVNIADGMNGRT